MKIENKPNVKRTHSYLSVGLIRYNNYILGFRLKSSVCQINTISNSISLFRF